MSKIVKEVKGQYEGRDVLYCLVTSIDWLVNETAMEYYVILVRNIWKLQKEIYSLVVYVLNIILIGNEYLPSFACKTIFNSFTNSAIKSILA